MTELWGRAWRIQVDDVVIEGDMGAPSIAVEFDVVRTLGKAPSTATVTLMNLAESTRSALQSAAGADKRGIFCSVEAGYIGATSEIFRGDLSYVRNYRVGPDWVTEVSSGDGERAGQKRTSRSYPEGTTVLDVIERLAEDMGVGIGNAKNAAKALQMAGVGVSEYYTGHVTVGVAQYELARVFRSLGLEWSIQSGQLQVMLDGKALDGVPLVKLSPSSGLLDSPSPADSKGVIQARCRIIPGLVPGWPVEVESKRVNGTFRIVRAAFSGASSGGEWEVGLEFKAIKS